MMSPSVLGKNRMTPKKVEPFLEDCVNKIEQKTVSMNDDLKIDNIILKYKNNLKNNPVVKHEMLRDIEKEIEVNLGGEVLLLYNQAIVYQLFIENFKRIEEKRLPYDVESYLKDDFNRILDFAIQANEDFLTFKKHQFCIYIEKLGLRCLPLGVIVKSGG